MPPRYLRKGTTRLKPCSEFKVEACDIAPADQCCGALPCALCLELEIYGEATTYGTATFGGSSWNGTVGGLAFVSYWEVPILPDIIPVPTLDSNSVGMAFSAIVEATYTMGSPVTEPGRDANETQHVESIEAFNIAKSQVSQEAYYRVMGVNPSHFAIGNNPVEMVSWDDANLFCARLGELPDEIAMGRTYRLPTEAEWEYACRSGATGAYFFGADPADLPTYGWFTDNSASQTQQRAYKTPNSAGLYDTHGNVWEWTSENGEASGFVRGGGWDSTAAECRSASRRATLPSTKANNLGFRVVMMQGPPVPIPQIGECEYVVTLDGEEVYRATCYEGASCRDPGGSVGVTIGYDAGTLTWTKHDPLPLPLTIDPDTGCNDFFCDSCRCTCESLCVELIDSFGAFIQGELGNVSYSCDPPVWEGTVGGLYLSLALGRDADGRCIITATVDGDEQDAVFAPGCGEMSAVIDLYGISQITVFCKDCSNCGNPPVYLCECRLDADHTCIGTVVSGATVCTVSPTACGPLTFGSPVGVSAPNKAWLDTWCRYHGLATYKLTAFPPDCIDAATPKRIVFVKKTTDEDAPWVDDTIVGVEDWYAVVYDSPEGTPTIFYEYSQCCLGASTTTGASSHLIRVTFSNLNLGGMIYDFVILNPTTLAAYGDCE